MADSSHVEGSQKPNPGRYLEEENRAKQARNMSNFGIYHQHQTSAITITNKT